MGERMCPGCRKTLLSRYSGDPICAPCARSSRGALPAAPVWLWDSAEIREALASADLPAFLLRVRSAMGLSQLELASLVGWSQSTVNRVENGERNTLYDIRELLRFADAIDMPRHALAPLFTGDEGAILALPGTNDDVEIDRRHFTGMLAGTLAAGAGWGSAAVPSRVDTAHVKHLESAMARLGAEDQRVGGALVLPSALRLLARARRMLDEASYSEEVGRRLLSLAGTLSVDAGWYAYDSGDQRLARHLYGEALICADHAGDQEVRVHAASLLAMQYVRLAQEGPGRAREALRFAAMAKEAARHWASPRTYALLALRETSAHAVLGDRTAWRKSISTAWREFERGPCEDDLTWTGFVSEGEMFSFEARSAMALGRPAAAVDLYQRAIAARKAEHAAQADERRNRSYGRACLADALLASGARSEALAEGLALLPDIGGSRRTLQELTGLREAADESSEFAYRYDRLLAA
ncbi:hypothetical protein Ssi03_56030 [Sphaerisporangium siamense]|uniref:Transcriptional regulator with XRE-family HTH domain n=1 Tax=Sphaerisporangium siamense TaxID=795645 RepID=A0A7W7DAQ3_9ACTN|nr:helix-turn-helix domain-containing protein [Sphaerisporangium siamense]MBB4703392.1 transcriptional regulator with XRE-family HTH domain [Sphaerisporangium siamense]GII87613.1 hypothetical protein Ssi03_56030 [Sphaerisporangium siamense]